jgi:hypothetical protein
MNARIINIGGKQNGIAAKDRRAFLPGNRNLAVSHAPGSPRPIARAVLAMDCFSVNQRLFAIVDSGMRLKKSKKVLMASVLLSASLKPKKAACKKAMRGAKEKIRIVHSTRYRKILVLMDFQ